MSRVGLTLSGLAFFAQLAAGQATSVATAPPRADRPDAREIPLPEIKSHLGAFPGVDELPALSELPDALTMQDGAKVKTVEQWRQRREEIKRVLAYYAVGEMPPAPGNVRGRELSGETVLEGKVKYRLIHLTFGPEGKVGLDIGIFTPSQGGPFPAIISQSGSPPGSTPLQRLAPGPGQGRGLDVLLPVEMINEQIAATDARKSANAAASTQPKPGPTTAPTGMEKTLPPAGSRAASRPRPGEPLTAEAVATHQQALFRRGYALIIYNDNDCAEDTTLRSPDGSWAFRSTRFPAAYPDYDWGILGAWAWGASRVADYLETDPAIDKTKLVITGASRAGKSALIAAAFDERLIGAPVVTGGGGIGAYRFAGPRGSETLDIMQKKYPNWFSPHLHPFWGQREKLPFDEHWFLALCAPRPFIALEGMNDDISLPAAVHASLLAAKPVYALFGAEDKLGVNYANHAHAFTEDDWTAMMDFVDTQVLGKKVERAFDRFPTEAEIDLARGK